MAPAKFTIAKPNGGVIPIAATTPAAQPNGADMPSKGPAPRLKIVIRRLPPGLTQAEFEAALGEEWKLGHGRVDWAVYRAGKPSTDLSKPSRPARAYLHLTDTTHLTTLSERVRQTSFTDARNTSNDAVLLGPPAVEFAPYNKIPAGRRRNDARQGTIDQDPEFIEFLEHLTNPVPKPAPVDSTADGVKKDETVTVTPLIQFLRDKKAAKDKPSAKSNKHNRQTSKAEADKPKTIIKATKDTDKKPGRPSRGEKGSREANKPGKKESTTTDAKPTTDESKTKAAGAAGAAVNTANTTSDKKKPPVSAATAAARMLQRDLGLKARERVKRGAAKTDDTAAAAAAAAATTATEQPSPSTPASAPPSTKPRPPKSKTSTPAPPTKQSPSQSTLTTQAFLKHANASQGITETTLREALGTFGPITKIELDKRKGFAYVDFATHEGLVAAMRASPVKVAQGGVTVLERRSVPGSGSSTTITTSTTTTTATPPATVTPAANASASATSGNTNTSARSGKGGGRGGKRGGRGGGGGRGGTSATSASGATAPTASTTTVQASTAPAPAT